MATLQTETTSATRGKMDEAAVAAPRRRSKQPRRQETSGYYADPMSPIASTPMKRPRTKATNTKSTKAKTPAAGPPPAPEDDPFFSPRKLVDEFDDEDALDGGGSGGATSTSTTTAAPATAAGGQADVAKENLGDKPNHAVPADPPTQTDHQVPPSVTGSTKSDTDGAMFSPVLKISKNARSPAESPGDVRINLDGAFAASEDEEHDREEHANCSRNGRDGRGVGDEVAVHCDESSTACESDAASDSVLETEFNPFVFIKSLPPYEELVPNGRSAVLPLRSKHTPNICLVLDLDETLVHCTVEDIENPHLQFPVTFNGVDYTVNVKKRPHMEYFLKQVARTFEVVVFTASHRAYAEKLLNLLDPRRELIKYRLYREDCLEVYGNYLKDLNVLGRQLSKVVLVDNSPHAFGFQVNNGIPIETWYDDEADDELLNLLPFLESLADVDDVRPVVEQQFQIQKLIDSLPDDSL